MKEKDGKAADMAAFLVFFGVKWVKTLDKLQNK